MSLVGFAAKNHPQQKTKDSVDDRGTTADLFQWCVARFGPFTVDVAAAPHNTKCPRYYTAAEDGLTKSWDGERVWCNPPYSNLLPWVVKAGASKAEQVVMLLPANRTEQPWWQEHIEPFRDGGGRVSTFFLKGRRRFILPGDTEVRPNSRPPFGLVVVVWGKK